MAVTIQTSQKNVIRAIKNEIMITKAGGTGKIIARMNSLVEYGNRCTI